MIFWGSIRNPPKTRFSRSLAPKSHCLDRKLYYLDRKLYCLDCKLHCLDRKLYCLDRVLYCLDRKPYCLDRELYCSSEGWQMTRRLAPGRTPLGVRGFCTGLALEALRHCSFETRLRGFGWRAGEGVQRKGGKGDRVNPIPQAGSNTPTEGSTDLLVPAPLGRRKMCNLRVPAPLNR